MHCFLPDGHSERCRDAGRTKDGWVLDPAYLELAWRRGREVVLGSCPRCGAWGELDDDQLHGRVSTGHVECGYHEVKDWWADHAAK
jgi:hypothetical protein